MESEFLSLSRLRSQAWSQKTDQEKFYPFWRRQPQQDEHRDRTSCCYTWDYLTVVGDTLRPVYSRGAWKLIKKKKKITTTKLEHSLRPASSLFRLAVKLLRLAVKIKPSPSPLTTRKRKGISTKKNKKITDADIKHFRRFLKKARQEMEFYDTYLSPTSDVIRHNSYVSGIMAKVPKGRIKYVPKPRLRRTVEDLIVIVNQRRNKDLLYQFGQFLRHQVINPTASASYILKRLRRTDEFKAHKFGDVRCSSLTFMLKCYLGWLSRGEYMPLEEAIDGFLHQIDRDRQVYEAHYQLEREQLAKSYWCPIHFLVHLERKMGYKIRHPVVEIAKLWTYHYPFDVKEELEKWNFHMNIGVSRCFMYRVNDWSGSDTDERD